MSDSAAVERVRVLIGDTDPTDEEFSSTEIERLLELNDGNVRLAAADALDILATRESWVMKQIVVAGVSTNGPAVATALREHADRLRQLAQDEADSAWDLITVNWRDRSWIREP